MSESTRAILARIDAPAPSDDTVRPQRTRPRPSAAARSRDYCRAGLHKLEGDNIRTYRRSNGDIGRECRACLRDRKRAQRKANPASPVPPDPVPCHECGGMIGPRIFGYSGWVLSGADGLCEVCYDRPRLQKYLAEYRTWDQETRRKKASSATRARYMLQRILVDGRAFHPDPDLTHGAGHAYGKFGCRCAACSKWKSDDNKARRDRGKTDRSTAA
ncbi:hypothetical protein QYN14_25670 [Rhodococcus ruber]|uniref:hypothetical protein n=1 Tax=Rhodococcus ruber TaxID=1830 RepID=UPI00265B2C37|nr:hypothetical protein [Rhodococcus ruber]WKK11938.1 hypothetical protein QYN14_25250 [Rhodococcus ruber]WKK12022.1 hypothetical protein QYN14_25670 [Rhodococcus ruber]